VSRTYTYDHFGKIATFYGDQIPVVQMLVKDYVKLFGAHVMLDIRVEELEERLKAKDAELKELQGLIDTSISNLDPDSK
jgi:hypothetical protein